MIFSTLSRPHKRPVNHVTRQPTCEIVCAIGDNKHVHLKTELRGHEDFSFGTAWHPSGNTFEAGSEDRTLRVRDVRDMSESLQVVALR